MAFKNTSTQYGSVAKFLHWLIFILLFCMIVGGFFMGDLPKEYKGTVYNLHKLTGLTILFLMLFNLFWALINVKPSLPAGTPRVHYIAARTVHWILYIIVIAMPTAGWIGASAAGRYPHIGDWKFALPVPQSKAIVGTAFDFHGWIAYAIIFFVTVHFLAAMYHYFIEKDDVLQRMLPWGK